MGDSPNLFHLTEDDFASKVLNADRPVIVDFWAITCGPCLALAPVFAQLSEKYQEKLVFAKLDTDRYEQIALRYGVLAIPTLLVFHHGQPVARLAGPRPAQLESEIEKILASLPE